MSNEIKYPYPNLKNLKPIKVAGFYDTNKDGIVGNDDLPNKLAFVADWVYDSFVGIQADMVKNGIQFVLTDAFRTYQIQEQRYKEVPKLAKPSGSSYHEAGCAVDVAMKFVKDDQLIQFLRVFLLNGWTPIGSVRTKFQEYQDKKIDVSVLKAMPEFWHYQRENLSLKFKGGIKEAIGYVGNLKV